MFGGRIGVTMNRAVLGPCSFFAQIVIANVILEAAIYGIRMFPGLREARIGIHSASVLTTDGMLLPICQH